MQQTVVYSVHSAGYDDLGSGEFPGPGSDFPGTEPGTGEEGRMECEGWVMGLRVSNVSIDRDRLCPFLDYG
jgi:hypothetical protein